MLYAAVTLGSPLAIMASGEAQATWEAGKINKANWNEALPSQPHSHQPTPTPHPPGASRGLGEQTGQLELIQHINKFLLGFKFIFRRRHVRGAGLCAWLISL